MRSNQPTSIAIVWMISLATGCTSFGESADVSNVPMPQPEGNYQLKYIDSVLFDAAMTRLLNDHAESIKIEIIGQMSLNDMPDRLQSWVDEAAKNGAKVDLVDKRDVPIERGFGISILESAYYFYKKYHEHNKARERNRIYGLAGTYDLDIIYDEELGILDAIIFKTKTAE